LKRKAWKNMLSIFYDVIDQAELYKLFLNGTRMNTDYTEILFFYYYGYENTNIKKTRMNLRKSVS